MKPDLLFAQKSDSVVISRPATEKTTAIVVAVAVIGLVFFALPWAPGSSSGYALSFFICIIVIVGLAFALWWELTCQWTITSTGKITKNAGPFSTIEYVRERSNVRVRCVEYQNRSQYLVEVVDDGRAKNIGVSRRLELAEQIANATACVLGGSMILDDSTKLKKNAEFRTKITPKGVRSALVLETVSWVVAVVLAYKKISPVAGAVVFVGAAIYVIWRIIKLSQIEKRADVILKKE